jgi:phytoene dehydrogenase-like protein
MSRAKTVVIGGGHNGLTAAAWLAKHGAEVVVLEAREALGGLCASEEFHDGYSVPGVLHDTRGVRPAIVDALGLERHGLAWTAPAPIVAPGEDAVWIHADRVEGGAKSDAENFAAWRAFVARVRPVLAGLLDRGSPDPAGDLWPLLEAGLKVRRLGADDMLELLRVMPMAVGDWLRDSFDSERLMAALAIGACEGCFTGPWSAGTASNLLLSEAVAGKEVAGGPAALVAALDKAARGFGVEIRTGARVKRIVVDRAGAVRGVELADGEVIDSARVLSSIDPKHTFLDLVGEQRLGTRFAAEVRNIRTRGTTAAVRLALSAPPQVDGEAVNAARIGETLDAVERAFDAAKYRAFAERPAIDARFFTGDGFAPDGHAAASLLVHAAAFDRRGGWDDAARTALGDAAVARLAEHFPGIEKNIVAREVLTPNDLATRYCLSGGHVHHGEHALDQRLFMRPTVECGRYATPVPGLFLCGSGSHPGGGVTCAPGALAAKSILG